jgi:hypothetical protein
MPDGPEAQPGGLVCFDGSYADAGRKLGEVAGRLLHGQMTRLYRERFEGKPWLLDLIRIQERVFRRFNAGWLEEITAAAEAAGLRFEQLMCANLLHAINLEDVPRPHEDCTLWACAGSASGSAGPMLHSTLDAPPPANVSVRAITGARRILGTGRFIFAGHPIWVNDAGLCHGSATGERLRDYPYREPGLSSIAICRRIAEQCATCEEAVEVFEQVYRDRLFARRVGCLHVFADRRKAMVLEQSADEFRYRMVEDGWVAGPSGRFSLIVAPTTTTLAMRLGAGTRHRTIEAAFARERPMTPATFDELARDTSFGPGDERGVSLLNAGTTALLSVHVDPEHPGVLSVAWIVAGRPTCTPYVPWFAGVEAAPGFYASGEAADLSEKVYARHGYQDALIPRVRDMDAAFRRKAAQAAARGRRLLQAGEEAQARQELTSASAECAEEARRFLDALASES